MKKTDKSKKSLAILVLSIITLAFFAACTNPLLPGPKKKPNPNRETGEVLSVSIAAAFDADGKGVTLTAEVTGDDGGELSYQWYSNAVDSNEEGTALADETTENFRPPTDTAGTSFYYIEVTNLLKGKTYEAVSGTVRIIVHPNGSVEVMVSEIETPTVTISTANDGGKVTLNAAAYVSDGGTLTYQWYKNAVNSSEGGTAIAGETKPAYTPPTSPNGTSYYYVRATSTLNRQTASAVSHTVRITVQGGSITEVLVSDSIETPTVNVTAAQIGGSVTLAATASVGDGGTLSYRWYKNTLDSSRGGTFITGATGTTFTPPVSSVDGASYYYVKVTNSLRGQTAEAVSNTVRIIVQGGSITEFVVSETIETPVVNVTAASDGVSVTLTATASVTDAGTITYQWYKNAVDNSKNGAIIAGATRSIYIPTVNNDGTTYYYVKVTNNLKGQTADAVSNTVKIIVQSGGITEWIVSDSVKTPSVNIAASVIGSSVTITATASATDNGTLSYQWYRNIEENSRSGSPIAGAVGITYMPSTASPGTTYYYVKVTNTLKGQTSTATSNVLGVTVHESGGSVDIIEVVDTPTVSILSSVNGRTVTITATASVNDGGKLSYQWYSNEHNNRNGEEITGATDRIYLPPTDAFGTTYYYVRVTNTLNGKTAVATSNIVGVAVPEGGGNIEVIEVETPDIDTPRVSIEANVNGRDVTITATALITDGGELTYQWYRNSKNNKEGTRIIGATETSYIPTTEAVSTVYYYVEVTNSLSGNVASATSNIVGVVVPEDGGSVVIVEAEIPVATVIASPAPGPYAMGAVVMLAASASTPSDGGIVSYQWYSNSQNNKNGTIINGAIGASYTAVTTSLGTTYYYVVATNTLKGQTASATSNIVEITVVRTEIRSAAVTVIGPQVGATPSTQPIKADSGNYTPGDVVWTNADAADAEVDGEFAGSTAYKATVTLTANDGYIFASNFTGRINNYSVTVVTPNDDGTVTLSHTFTKTFASVVGNVAINANPTKMQYITGDTLDLTGLQLTITFSDNSTKSGAYTELSEELGDNLTASPEHGGQLIMTTHNAKAIVINVGGKTAQTSNFLTITQKALTFTVTTPSRTLSPLDTTATFTITVNGLANDHAVNVSIPMLSNYGLTSSSTLNIENNTARNVTLTYDGTTPVAQATALSLPFTVTASESVLENYTLPNTAVAPTICDGQAADRAIPVTQENIVRSGTTGFNTYANTTAGLSKHYKLMEDVTLTAPAAGQSNWTAIGTNTNSLFFTGSFDGQKKTIINLTINNSSTLLYAVGMFGYTQNATIRNLGLKDVNIISSGTMAGGVVGRSDASMIENCFVTGSVSSTYAGGVVGGVYGSGTKVVLLQNCYSTVSVTASNTAGGVVGIISNCIVTKCFATGSVVGSTAGGVVGNINNSNPLITMCVAANEYPSEITSTYSDYSRVGCIWGSDSASSGSNYNYRFANITLRYDTTKIISAGGTANGKSGDSLNYLNEKNPRIERFWVTASNWGGSTAWDLTNIWEWSSTLTRPILRGFTADVQE